MSSRGKSLDIEGTPCRREMVWSAKPMIYDIDIIFKWLINKNEKRVEKGRPWRHGMVWAEKHPGRRPRAVIPIKLWLVSQTPETALAFFPIFHQFSLTFSARCHKKFRLVGQTPETALALTLFSWILSEIYRHEKLLLVWSMRECTHFLFSFFVTFR